MEGEYLVRATRHRNLHSREKEIIYSVNKFCLEEKAKGAPIIDFSKATARTARATNVSERTVERLTQAELYTHTHTHVHERTI